MPFIDDNKQYISLLLLRSSATRRKVPAIKVHRLLRIAVVKHHFVAHDTLDEYWYDYGGERGGQETRLNLQSNQIWKKMF